MHTCNPSDDGVNRPRFGNAVLLIRSYVMVSVIQRVEPILDGPTCWESSIEVCFQTDCKSDNATADNATLSDKHGTNYAVPSFNETFLQAVYPHVASFNTFLSFFLPELVKDLSPIYVDPSYDRHKHELDPFYAPSECKVLSCVCV